MLGKNTVFLFIGKLYASSFRVVEGLSCCSSSSVREKDVLECMETIQIVVEKPNRFIRMNPVMREEYKIHHITYTCNDITAQLCLSSRWPTQRCREDWQ